MVGPDHGIKIFNFFSSDYPPNAFHTPIYNIFHAVSHGISNIGKCDPILTKVALQSFILSQIGSSTNFIPNLFKVSFTSNSDNLSLSSKKKGL